MVWLWLSFPVLLLGAALVLWRAAARIDRLRHLLEGELAAVRASGPVPARR
jgi:hypothetical protein